MIHSEFRKGKNQNHLMLDSYDVNSYKNLVGRWITYEQQKI